MSIFDSTKQRLQTMLKDIGEGISLLPGFPHRVVMVSVNAYRSTNTPILSRGIPQ